MFNIGAAELILILLVAFLVVGPKDLPKVARALGRFVRYIRTMMDEVKRESGLDEFENEIKAVEHDLKDTAKSADIQPDLQKAQLNINKELKDIEKDIGLQDVKNILGGKKK